MWPMSLLFVTTNFCRKFFMLNHLSNCFVYLMHNLPYTWQRVSLTSYRGAWSMWGSSPFFFIYHEKNLCRVCLWEMSLKILKTETQFNIRINIWRKFDIVFKQDHLYLIIKIFCVWYQKADLINYAFCWEMWLSACFKIGIDIHKI